MFQIRGWVGKVCCYVLPAVLASFSVANGIAQRESGLDEGFRHPPATSRPWVFWMWLRVQTNREAIAADLEAMHAKGIEGAILYDSGVGGGMEADRRMVVDGKGYRQVSTRDFADAHFTSLPYPPMPSWQPASRELIRFASAEAARLGIKLVLTVGLASTSGPIELKDSQKRLIWSETQVGPGVVDAMLPTPHRGVAASRVAVTSMVPERAEVGEHPDSLHPVAVLALPDKTEVRLDDVIDISRHVDASGHLRWDAPAGRWRIFRFCYEPTRMTNAWGLYTDAMDAAALDRTWNVTIGKLLSEMTPEERRGLYGVEDDSWEAGASTWTARFADEFQSARGYSLARWLPVLAGVQIGTPTQSEEVRRDFYRTIADLIATNHYAHLAELARRNHLVSFSEAAGPNSAELDPEQNAAHIDIPMGEFWIPSQHRPTPERRFLAHDAASSAHMYGQRVIACESFTSVGPHWETTFFDLKNTADQGFTEGCNLNVIHNFSQSPSVTARPGYVYFAGTHYGRNTTWWNQTPAFNAYLGRASFLLQQGHFVADALYFRGDAIGQIEQMKRRLPAEGYDHDNINLDAFLHRLYVSHGILSLPDGMTYRLLVLPDSGTMSLPALRKLTSLVKAGAVVVGPRPTGLAGLPLSPADVSTFHTLISQLWKDDEQSIVSGHVFSGSPAEAVRLLHLHPDAIFSGVSSAGEIDWIHRRTQTADIYFVASRWDHPENVTATFRVEGRQPELWDPVTGEIRDAHAFAQHGGTTSLPLAFGPRGSIFVVFRKRIGSGASGPALSNSIELTPFATLRGPWHVHFDPRWGGPAETLFTSLQDWTHRDEPGIRFYSGSAMYSTDFAIRNSEQNVRRLYLDLGEVHEVADVRLNGRNLGTVWTHPARIDITSAVRTGSNHLEVTVTNLWPNRLIGDEALPSSERFTQTNAHKFGVNTPLYPSGLLGPVRLERSENAVQ